MKSRVFNHIVMMMLLICWTVVFSGTAMAATRKITSVSLEVRDRGQDYPEISVSRHDNYYIDEITYDKGNENLTVGTIVRPLVTLVPKDGYEFKVSSSSSVKVLGSGSGNTKLSVNGKKEKVKILVIYTINGRPDTPNVYWEESSAPWNARCTKTNATHYEFSLYKGSELVERHVQVGQKYNFSKSLSKAGVCERNDVYFTVRAIFNGNYSEDIAVSEYYEDWGELREFCDKVSVEWKWKDTDSDNKDTSSNSGAYGVPYPGAK